MKTENLGSLVSVPGTHVRENTKIIRGKTQFVTFFLSAFIKRYLSYFATSSFIYKYNYRYSPYISINQCFIFISKYHGYRKTYIPIHTNEYIVLSTLVANQHIVAKKKKQITKITMRTVDYNLGGK